LSLFFHQVCLFLHVYSCFCTFVTILSYLGCLDK
jgi:hypothetical protein